MDLPFEDIDRRKYGTEQIYKIRRFKGDVNPEDLIWHRDKETRLVTVIKSVGWKFQFDEQLPFEANTSQLVANAIPEINPPAPTVGPAGVNV